MGKFSLWSRLKEDAVPAMASRCQPETSTGNLGSKGGDYPLRELPSILDPVGVGGSEKKFRLWDFALEKSALGLALSRVRKLSCVAFKACSHENPSETSINIPTLETRKLRL